MQSSETNIVTEVRSPQHHHEELRGLSGVDQKTFTGTQPLPSNNNTPSSACTTPPKHWTYFHIPKTAGDSFMRDSPAHMPIGSTLKGNNEVSLAKTPRKNKDPLATFLREPTSHVLSQYLECKYDWWGRKMTNNTGFPGYYKLEEPLNGFDRWIHHFTKVAYGPKPQYGSESAFRCYDPFNMQSRYFTIKPSQGYVHFASVYENRFPKIESALKALDMIQVVGIVEYYAASVCLWEYHAGGRQFLTEGCQTCDYEKQELQFAQKQKNHERHGVPPHSVSMISQTSLDWIQNNFTTIDQQLYQAGVSRFFRQVEEVWNETGIDLLCRPESKEEDGGPLPTNFTGSSGSTLGLQSSEAASKVESSEVVSISFVGIGLFFAVATLVAGLLFAKNRSHRRQSRKNYELLEMTPTSQPY